MSRARGGFNWPGNVDVQAPVFGPLITRHPDCRFGELFAGFQAEIGYIPWIGIHVELFRLLCREASGKKGSRGV